MPKEVKVTEQVDFLDGYTVGCQYHEYQSDHPMLSKYRDVTVFYPLYIEDGRKNKKHIKHKKNENEQVDDRTKEIILMAMGFK